MGEFLLNGKSHPTAPGMTVSDLLRGLKLDPRWVVAEVNGQATGRELFDRTRISPGDRVELVRPMAGG
ncbi:MAG: sulfur carrier protein ThiS [Gemmatimonadota bacterium]|jgi:sulfur carrier protein|nr:thiamine biosynthesis protein ThiS [Gemmatimonadota bacterium]MDP6460594.1 sulfur carrier protein ThiS [Gemmatimonadota bacterium]MDP6528479.1 sulfur carrier protein ThiS [Gemmatimonadota bacterium]MDP6803012.1 sulfur carrier protein ThiS [Gemmatimonadota bacterium]MDP7032275.1 sulfur carrier protein ThiS [Gemmatimonadota bacterium]